MDWCEFCGEDAVEMVVICDDCADLVKVCFTCGEDTPHLCEPCHLAREEREKPVCGI